MKESNGTSKWIWYYGEYELFHSLKLHTRREEYDRTFPPFYKLSGIEPLVRFRKVVNLERDGVFTVKINGQGRVRVDETFFATDSRISVEAGEHAIEITVINYSGLPAAYAEGDIVTDETWTASFCTVDYTAVGASPEYLKATDNVEKFKFAYKTIKPVETVAVDGGFLYDFGKETFGKLVIKGELKNCAVYYGESKPEALSKEGVVCEKIKEIKTTKVLRQRAFRYIFIETVAKPKEVLAKYEYLPYKDIGKFSCDEELVKKIYDMSAYTFRLCSREFYLDGIKRDRWVWSGDSYQSIMINRYLCRDDEIIKRTIIALLGKPPYVQHINSINDYSAYLILTVYDYYFDTGDEEFVKAIYQRVRALFEFITSRLDENGFVVGRQGDWVFIDWGNFDREGPHSAEQILYWKAACVMQTLANIVKDNDVKIPDTQELKEKIYKYYYDKNLGGFIDGYKSGKKVINRHQNIFAILYDFATETEKREILEKVLLNSDVEKIKTPYFEFFELLALCKMGKIELAQNMMTEYWGGMIDDGATTFYERYDAEQPEDKKYGMYGTKYDKSLCHCWGSGPIVFLGKYVAGVKTTSVGGKTFEVKPEVGRYKYFNAVVPIAGGKVTVSYKDGKISVLSDVDGGTLIWKDKTYLIEKNKILTK